MLFPCVILHPKSTSSLLALEIKTAIRSLLVAIRNIIYSTDVRQFHESTCKVLYPANLRCELSADSWAESWDGSELTHEAKGVTGDGVAW